MAEVNQAREVERLFKAAADLPAEKRSGYLDTHCAPDSLVRKEVEELLEHLESAGDEFLTPPWRTPESGTGTDAPLPEWIDRYRILSKIGEGGMGVVYEAEQRQPRRRVALKVVRPTLPAAQLRRFQYESEVLGRLQHPGIAHIYEAGIAVIEYPGGASLQQPFFAMEFIDGLPFLDHVAERNLGIEQRLQLLCRICDAVQYAHQRGVIHRDLKPANILIDNNGQPKILDFGVARAATPDRAEPEHHTQAGEILGTLPYMSPEQLDGDPSLTDTRSDVYALGVLLYQLLTGELPYRFPRGTMEEVLRRLGDDRFAPPGSLHSEHRGDLDVITAMALERDKEQRYRSPAALAADLRRHLSDEPIEARANSGWYVMRKQIRRHRFPVAVGSAFLIALIIFAAVSWSLFVTAEHAREEAEFQHQQATEQLWESYLVRARLGRITDEPGRRSQSLEAIRLAAEIRPSMELRNEVLACMALSDLSEERVFAAATEARSVGLDRIDRFAEMVDSKDLRVVSIETGEEIAYLPGPGVRPWVYVFSPTGRYLAVKYHGSEGPVRLWVWDVERAEIILRLAPDLFSRFSSAIDWERGVETSRWVALAETDQAIHLYALPSGTPLKTIAAGTAARAIAVEPKGHRMAVASKGEVAILDIESGKEILRIPTRPQIFNLSWNVAGTLLAGAGGDHLIHLWDTGSGEVVRTLAGHESAATRVGFGPEHLLVSYGWDGTTRIWDPLLGREVFDALQDRELGGVGDRSIGVLDAMDSYTILRLEPSRVLTSIVSETAFGQPSCAVITPDGSAFATGGANGLRLWDFASGAPIADLFDSKVRDIVFSANGDSIYAATREGLLRWNLTLPYADRMQITGPELLRESDEPFTLCWTPDKRSLILCNVRGSMFEIDPRDGRLLTEFPDHYGMESPVISRDGRWIFTGNWKGQAGRLWDANSQEVVREFPDLSVKGAFSPDGSRLIVSTQAGFLGIECASWTETFTIDAPERNFTGHIAFAPDGKLVAVTYKRSTIRLVHANSGELIAEFTDPALRSITHLEFTSDGTRLIAMTSDREIRIWNLANARADLRALGLDWES